MSWLDDNWDDIMLGIADQDNEIVSIMELPDTVLVSSCNDIINADDYDEDYEYIGLVKGIIETFNKYPSLSEKQKYSLSCFYYNFSEDYAYR